MDKVKIKRGAWLACACVAAVAFVAATVTPRRAAAFANSGPSKEFGVTASGIIVREEGSALAVERERLVFDLQDFPEPYYGETPTEYEASVTAEYTFVNTSGNTVHTSMAFPICVKPYYAYGYEEENYYPDTPTITVDGSVIDCEVRHTYNAYKNFDESVADIYDGWYEDGFYSPDLPVTAFCVALDKESDYRLSTGEFSRVVAKGRVTCGAGARFMCPDFDSLNGDMRFYFSSNPNYSNIYTFYVLGDASQFSCEWRVEKNFTDITFADKKTDLKVEATEEGATTLKELILSKRGEKHTVSEQDYYNAFALNFLTDGGASAEAGYAGFAFTLDERNFCTWYTYETEVAPYGKIVNSVTAPMYPTIMFTYRPYKYEYVYYLSPAAKWKYFEELEIEIKTPFFLSDAPAGFERTESGYRAVFDGLPQGELSFKLCAEERPLTKILGFWIDGAKFRRTLSVAFSVLGGVAAGAVAIVVTVILVKKYKK
ncbi:MAG: hypothetical protein K2L72_05400 [Clostridia bacterium]|nr:hypothetical protein [Clostridia bacterium]